MTIPSKLIEKIDMDIENLKAAIADTNNSRTPEFAKSELCQDIGNSYDAYITDFGKGLYNYNYVSHFYDSVEGESLQHNLRALLAKLEAYKAFDFEKPASRKITVPSITVSPTFQNTNSNQITFNISFVDARKIIEDMPGLTDSETKEILTKIDEIKALAESSEHKKTKWEKAKPIIKWIAEKSIDVGTTLLPLLLNIK